MDFLFNPYWLPGSVSDVSLSSITNRSKERALEGGARFAENRQCSVRQNCSISIVQEDFFELPK
jgi:hypothetical protein